MSPSEQALFYILRQGIAITDTASYLMAQDHGIEGAKRELRTLARSAAAIQSALANFKFDPPG